MKDTLKNEQKRPPCGLMINGSESPCKNPRVPDGKGGFRLRCSFHGCGTSPSSGKIGGGQPGNQNALKHGEYTREALEFWKKEKAKIQEFRNFFDFVMASDS